MSSSEEDAGVIKTFEDINKAMVLLFSSDRRYLLIRWLWGFSREGCIHGPERTHEVLDRLHKKRDGSEKNRY
jgi:hypothetical protein